MRSQVSYSVLSKKPRVIGASVAPRFAVVGTYTPRICGIATFTEDFVASLNTDSLSLAVDVVAMNSPDEALSYPPEVISQIRQENREDYLAAAAVLNSRNLRAVSLQHEFGIYGGADGELVIDFLEHVQAPVVTTLHTVLQRATPHQREVLRRISALSARIVVMSQTARDFLTELYGVPAEKIEVIPHGVPHQPFSNTAEAKRDLGLQGKKTILTFGLLSANKGIENMIRAMPAIVHEQPTATYIVLGAGHPRALSETGEAYVDGLKRLVREVGMESNIRFETRFVELDELCRFLGAADVYVTPYVNEDQITSGTLSYALGCGVATVSTPYWHARELLAEGRGRLVPFLDPAALSREVIDLLADDEERERMRRRAYAYSSGATWQTVGRSYLATLASVSGASAFKQSHPELDVSVA